MRSTRIVLASLATYIGSVDEVGEDAADFTERTNYYEAVCPGCGELCTCRLSGPPVEGGPFLFEMQANGRVLVTIKNFTVRNFVAHLCAYGSGGGDLVPAKISPDSPPPHVLAAERAREEAN